MATPDPMNPPAVARGFLTTWQRVVTDPRGFFADMPETGGLGEPAAFLALCSGICGVGEAIVGLTIAGAIRSVAGEIAGAFAVAALLVLIAQHLFGGRAGFEPTFRVVAYSAAPLVAAWLPRIGPLALVWSWFLLVRGTERVQGFDTVRAVATVAVGIGVTAFGVLALSGALPR
jgi:hypothetical protein